MKLPTVGIVGFGDFARLMVREFPPFLEVVVSSRTVPEDKEAFPCKFVDTKTVLSQKVIIPSMPAQFLEGYFTENLKFVNKNALVIDVCSVKVKPIQTLLDVLPQSVSILATHPMFGPVSAAEGLFGKKIMMHPTRIKTEQYEKIKQFASETLGLNVIETTPEKHDRIMAYVQGLSHYIARTMQIMDIPDTEMATNAYEDLFDMKQVQGNDSWELFESIMRENPYAGEVNDHFKRAMKELDEKLENSQK